MASLAQDKTTGGFRILFFDLQGERKTIRIPKCAKRSAAAVKLRVEFLIAAKRTNTAPDGETLAWVAGLDDDLHGKLAAHGLVAPREKQPAVPLGPWLENYIANRADLKPSTKLSRRQVIADLSAFLGANRDVQTVTPGDADDFKQWLIGRKLATSTIHKRLQVARSFFIALRRRKLVADNPFEGVSSPATGIQDRQRFVTRQEIEKVLAACPDGNWRTIVALSRYGGLRCPSEVLSLRWQDIDWDAERIVVRAPKMEHHADKASRVIPLFAELRPYLADAFDAAPEGAEYVVDERFRKGALGPNGWVNMNLRTTFEKIIARAGLDPWPRLFHNLRASRETELVETFPVQAVTSWLGNSPTIAMRHYLMTTESHFEQAVKGPAEEPPIEPPTTPNKAAQNPAQSVSAGARTERTTAHFPDTNPREKRGYAMACDIVHKCSVAREGLEPPTKGL